VDTDSVNTGRQEEYVESNMYRGGDATHNMPGIRSGPVNRRLPELGYSAIQAVDVNTGAAKCQFKMVGVTDSGVLATASDLVFAGRREDYFMPRMREAAQHCGSL
jgi:hypothetical protein